MISLIGMGSGCPESLTAQGLAALQGAGLILGAKRLLEHLPAGCTADRKAVYKPEDILACLAAQPDTDTAVLYSGDTGFYSGAGKAAAPAAGHGILCPGAARAFQRAAFSRRCGTPLAGLEAGVCPWPRLRPGSRGFGASTGVFPHWRRGHPCHPLRQADRCRLGAAHALVGENLGTPAEAIRFGLARELAAQSFAPLSVLLIEREALPPRRAPGLPDDAFIRGAVPMTKQEVRAAALAKLAVTPTDTLWDVGAGTGSVSVELALAAPAGQIYAIECDPEACALTQKNREKFAAYNLTVIEGKAPEALDALPTPDAVFIGGTKGNMDAVINAVLHKNPTARLCIAAIALETLSAAVAALTAHGLAAEVTQISVSRTKTAGSLHLLMANNPVFLITGART